MSDPQVLLQMLHRALLYMDTSGHHLSDLLCMEPFLRQMRLLLLRARTLGQLGLDIVASAQLEHG